MKLLYMRQEVLEDLKNNIDKNIGYYIKDNNDWIYQMFENPFLEFKRTVPDFELTLNLKDVGVSDLENVKILHNNLRSLTKTEASDERLWAGLTHSIFWEYMIKRWERRPASNNIDVENRFFLRGKLSHRRALVMNSLSRLWWIGELLYAPENIEDPYYLLELFRGDFTTNIHTFISSSFTSNPKITKAVLTSALNYKRANGKISRKQFQEILRYANLLGGSYLLDYLEGYEIQGKIDMYINTVMTPKEKDIEDEYDLKNNTMGEVAEKKGILEKIKAAVIG